MLKNLLCKCFCFFWCHLTHSDTQQREIDRRLIGHKQRKTYQNDSEPEAASQHGARHELLPEVQQPLWECAEVVSVRDPHLLLINSASGTVASQATPCTRLARSAALSSPHRVPNRSCTREPMHAGCPAERGPWTVDHLVLVDTHKALDTPSSAAIVCTN